MMVNESWFRENQLNWDDRARLHEAAGYGIDELVSDPAYIIPEVAQDRDLIGDLTGKSVLHLQCHLGTGTISLARLGAEHVIGLDLSPESLRRANRIAGRAGAEIDFVQANVYDARRAVTEDFDLVYTSLGVLCWLPDVDEWARVVHSLLMPGGRFIIRDDHPMFMAIGEDVSEGLKIEQPYFQQRAPQAWEDDGSYIDAKHAPRIQRTKSHEWNHSISEILTAVLNTGLVIDSFEETNHSAWRPWPHLMERDGDTFRLRENPDRLALQWVMSAHRPS